MQIRQSAFAGSFYPRNRVDLESTIRKFLGAAKIEKKHIDDAFSYVVPHAGYIYSGKTAAYAYKALSLNSGVKSIDDIIIIGPNHTGVGTPISVSDSDWETPIGTSKTDLKLAQEICSHSKIAVVDESAHAGEHSIEVQLPFFQYLGVNKNFVFVCMGDQNLKSCDDLSNAITKASSKLGKHCLIVASSDFNHYESAEVGDKKDSKLFKSLEDLDYASFHQMVDKIGDTVCGFGPITVAAMYAKRLGGKTGVLLNKSNSGDTTKNYKEVVDYAAFAFV